MGQHAPEAEAGVTYPKNLSSPSNDEYLIPLCCCADNSKHDDGAWTKSHTHARFHPLTLTHSRTHALTHSRGTRGFTYHLRLAHAGRINRERG